MKLENGGRFRTLSTPLEAMRAFGSVVQQRRERIESALRAAPLHARSATIGMFTVDTTPRARRLVAEGDMGAMPTFKIVCDYLLASNKVRSQKEHLLTIVTHLLEKIRHLLGNEITAAQRRIHVTLVASSSSPSATAFRVTRSSASQGGGVDATSVVTATVVVTIDQMADNIPSSAPLQRYLKSTTVPSLGVLAPLSVVATCDCCAVAVRAGLPCRDIIAVGAHLQNMYVALSAFDPLWYVHESVFDRTIRAGAQLRCRHDANYCANDQDRRLRTRTTHDSTPVDRSRAHYALHSLREQMR